MDRYIRFEAPDGIGWGTYQDGEVVRYSDNPACGGQPDGRSYEPTQIKLLAPVKPSKIICVGLNYKEHVGETRPDDDIPEEPVLFMKPPSSVIGPGAGIEMPEVSERVDYEGELGIIIGRTCRNVAAVEAEDYVFGITCVNDVTARDLQKKDKQWTRAKGFDTFCPVGPWVIDTINYEDLQLQTFVNGELKQETRTSRMIFPVNTLIAYISKIMTLYPGDLISTGTPSGISPLGSGDRVEVRIEGIGSLVNDVI
jgi:2-keto-4-pentenoate hydratase/2-oxohepta-3-ene-1,7-dioic acid hydratase in catechol pathway